MQKSEVTPPRAKSTDFQFEHLGRTFSDPYRWLQDKSNPEVIAYLEAENAYAKSMLAHTVDFQEELYQEMKARIKEDDSAPPAPYGDYEYYTRTQTGQQYRLFCRRARTPDAAEEILLDENELAEGMEYCKVGLFEPSPNNQLVAYGVDTTGSWVWDLYVKDTVSGEIISGPIPNTAWTLAWASDSNTLFYTVFDDSHRAYQLKRRVIDQQTAEDDLIYHETDDAFAIKVERARSGAYLILTTQSASTTEVHVLPADDPAGESKVIHPRQHWMEYYVEHHSDQFLIRTNEDALNFKLMRAPVDNPAKENWQPIIPHRDDVMIEDMLAFKDFLAVVERRDGLRQLRLSPPDNIDDVSYVNFPEPVYTFSPYENLEFNTSIIRFKYQSLVTPESTVDYDTAARAWTVIKQTEIPSGHNPDDYEMVRLHATAPDGARVPISVVYRKGIELNGSNPCLLYGYGSYGFNYDPWFQSNMYSLIDRGFVFAIGHIRGSSTLGRDWYEKGRLQHKINTFTDFIACAEHLIESDHTSSDRLAIMGGSAGGLLMSAVVNMRPELFKSAVAMVPFTNVITAMLDRDLPLTVIEWEEWGNPDKPDEFDYMLSYSPYENVKAQAYPNLYVKGGLNDLQVPFWDPAKWVARLRELKTDDNRLILVTNMGAGHHGSSGRFDKLREVAEYTAFLIDSLGLPLD